ncbi:MAG: translation elongation factor Ts [Deltaproteobacteria bacterium]|uniref:Elongation factor Ts n=1 Tax=Candidatus Zymogenus saltonus TaxID=2844893 RepID=A0A9D8KAD7_9DELT|nr:translation elongation factor Ts [Candidatus Zymogenus saltonus]
MEINAQIVKELREKTGAGMMDCKGALTEAGGDMEKAIEFLRKKGLSRAAKRAGRAANEGAVGSYIHMGGKIGVLVEVNCESDFVAKNEDFQSFAKDIAMHIAASSPLYLNEEDVPGDVIEKEREIYKAQAKDSGKPDSVIDKIVDGKLKKFYTEVCLLDQPYVKDTDMSVTDYLNNFISKTGENIVIRRFVRFQLGEEL